MKYILDRIEGKTAVFEAEDMTTLNVSVSKLIPVVKIGGSYVKSGEAYILDADDTVIRAKRIKEKLDRIFKK